VVFAIENYQVFGSSNHREFAFKEAAYIAGIEPSVYQDLCGCFGLVEVAFHERRSSNPDHAGLAFLYRRSL